MYYTNIELSKKLGGGSRRSKKPIDVAMIRDTNSCNRERLNRRMVLNVKHTRERNSNDKCLQ